MTTQLEEQTTNVVGARMKRVEDPRMITGAAKYIDDLKLSGMAHVAVLRSPYAHARIRGIDTSRAEAHPDVIDVFTGKDFEHLNPLPCAWQAGGVENFVATPRTLEIDRVTFTGAGVAAVVVETRAAAEDALSLIDVRETCGVLAATAEAIGDRQVRNRGTIGGSLAHADPGADYPTVITALGATVVVQGTGGEREIAADELFTGVFTTALEQGELITAVRVPALGAGVGAAYEKHRHPASGYAAAGVAVVVKVDVGKVTEARIAVGGVTGTPVRATAAEQAMIGIAPADEAAIVAAAGKVAEGLSGAIGDTYATGEYRVHLAQVLAKRALTAAIEAAA